MKLPALSNRNKNKDNNESKHEENEEDHNDSQKLNQNISNPLFNTIDAKLEKFEEENNLVDNVKQTENSLSTQPKKSNRK